MEEFIMQNWREYCNYRKQRNEDGSITYFITIEGDDVKVTKEIYTAYAEDGRKMIYTEIELKYNRLLKDSKGRNIKDENGLNIELPEREISFDKLISEDWEFPSSELSPEDVVVPTFSSEIEELYRCLGLLNAREQVLVQGLFFEGRKGYEYAEKFGVSKQRITQLKKQIFKKIEKFWENP
jgi:DNA-directed RNA polymerase specialized sigma subunit